MQKLRAFQAQHFNEFKCTGGKCKDNCCQGWQIYIGIDTYEKLMKFDEDIRKSLISNIVVESKEPFKARISLDEKAQCSFLDEQGLCSIQNRCGYENLFYICRTFPRWFCFVDDAVEAYLDLSCMVSVKLTLFNSKPLGLEETLIECDDDTAFNGVLNINNYTSAKNGVDIFWSLRQITLFIVKNRNYKLWERMTLLGLFIENSAEYLSTGQDSEILNFADEFAARTTTGFYRDFLRQIPCKSDKKTPLISIIINNFENIGHKTLYECIWQMKAYFGIEADNHTKQQGSSHELSVNTYAGRIDSLKMINDLNEAYHNYYLPYFETREYVLENLVISLILMSGFPFDYGTEQGIFKNYSMLIIKYMSVKLLLIGMAGYQKEKFNEGHITDAVFSMSRVFRSEYASKIFTDYIDSINAYTTEDLSILFKDQYTHAEASKHVANT